MKAVNYYLIVQKIKESKTVGGLLITDDLDEENRYTKAKVVSVGNLVDGIKENDIIYYAAVAGHDISYNDDMYRVIRARDIVLVE